MSMPHAEQSESRGVFQMIVDFALELQKAFAVRYWFADPE
jgi:hypothetical protein